MKLPGKYYKDGKFWITEIPVIDFMDQGKTKAEALKLAGEAIALLVNKKGFTCKVHDDGDGEFILSSDDTGALLSFILKRMREAKGLSIRDVREVLGTKSHTEYARHESGKTSMTIDKFTSYVKAISKKDVVLSIA